MSEKVRIPQKALASAATWGLNDVTYEISNGPSVFVKSDKNFVIGQDFLTLTGALPLGPEILLFAMLHEMWHIQQIAKTPDLYRNLSERPAMECEADAHGAYAIAKSELSMVSKSSEQDVLEATARHIAELANIPDNFPSLSAEEAVKHNHLNPAQRRLAVIFGLLVGVSDLYEFPKYKRSNYVRLKRQSRQVNSLFSIEKSDEERIKDLCLFVTSPKRSFLGIDDLVILPIEISNRTEIGNYEVLTSKYSIRNSSNQPLQYEFLKFEGLAPKDRPDDLGMFKYILRYKIKVDARSTTEFETKTLILKIDGEKFVRISEYEPGRLDLVKVLAPPVPPLTCFDNFVMKNLTKAEIELAAAVRIGSAAINQFEAVKGTKNMGTSSGPLTMHNYNFSLPKDTNGYLNGTRGWYGVHASLDLYSGDNEQDAIDTFERTVAYVKARCNAVPESAKPLITINSDKRTVDIAHFTLGSSASLRMTKMEDEDDPSDVSYYVSWSFSQSFTELD